MTERYSNIVVRAPNWIGDAVLALPAIERLRGAFPSARLTVLARTWVGPVFETLAGIDDIWSEDKPRGPAGWTRVARRVRSGRFDLAVLLPNSFESALTMFAAGVPERTGYRTDGRGLLLTVSEDTPSGPHHHAEYYMHLALAVERHFAMDRGLWTGAVTEVAGRRVPMVTIAPSTAMRDEARSLLNAAGIGESSTYVVLNPGAAYGSAKRWPDRGFAAVADQLMSVTGLPAVIVGSRSELPIARSIAGSMRQPPVMLSGQTTLGGLIGVLARAAAMITNDSGPMHLAAALGRPTVAVFGPTDETNTGPCGSRVRVVREPVDCSPCLLRECPIDHRCMIRVRPEAVAAAALELMQT